MNSRPPPFPQPFAVPVSAYPAPSPMGMGNAPYYAAPNPVTHTVHPPSMPSPGVPPFPQPPVRSPAYPHGSAGHPPAFPIPFSPAAQAPMPPVRTPHTIQRTATIPMPSLGRTADPNMQSVHTPRSLSLPGTSEAAQFFAEDWRHQDDWAGGTFEQHSSVLRYPEEFGTYPGTQANPLFGQPQPSRHTAPHPTAPQPATERCRLCQSPIQRDVAEHLNGFCSDQHMWGAINASTAILCPTCRRRACRPGRRFCSDTCGRG
ncbi:hypothetical protein BJV78DRAFT_522761 [Lactifluus subvellereus]|nr:hypothetical protein BJV78DRAFT_522761 [Lactifluus subvellereus]